MKRLHFFVIAWTLTLVATALSTSANAQKRVIDDRRAYGLVGNVEHVTTSTQPATMQNGEVIPLSEEKSFDEMTFNEQGLVTLDLYGNTFEYDGQGNFIGKGERGCAEMTRNADGKIATYHDVCDDEDVESHNHNFFYDSKGRMDHVEMTFWESTFNISYTYEGDNVYPETIYTEQYDQGSIIRTKYSMVYTNFDAQGNWTKREVYITRTESEETIEGESESITTQSYEIEERIVSYY